jgi:hypothetical protein
MVRSAVLLFGDVLLSDCCGRCVGVFLAGDEDRFTNPTKSYSSSIFLMLEGSVLPQSLW